MKPEHLSFAFGLYYFSNKLIAQIPGPILFGHVVDLSCEIWQKVCDKTGFCMLYDVDYMMLQLAIITGTLGGKFEEKNSNASSFHRAKVAIM